MKSSHKSTEEAENDTYDMLLEDGMNIFILKMKRASSTPVISLGFETVDIKADAHPNNGMVNYNKKFNRNNHLTFYPDKHNIPTAKLVDTPFNRAALANCFWNTSWDISGMITPSGTVVGPVVRAEIEKLARDRGITPPSAKDAFEIEIESRKKAEIKKRMTPEDISDEVEEKNEALINFLKKKHGEQYRKTAEYKEIIRPEIRKALEAYGFTKDVLDRMKEERSMAPVNTAISRPGIVDEEDSSLVRA